MTPRGQKPRAEFIWRAGDPVTSSCSINSVRAALRFEMSQLTRYWLQNHPLQRFKMTFVSTLFIQGTLTKRPVRAAGL